MRKLSLLSVIFFFYGQGVSAQHAEEPPDSNRNNLVLPAGYATSERGAIPVYRKRGNGGQAVILLPGMGFDASVFNDFMEANGDLYTQYALTLPGYGGTPAPPMPDAGTSYGAQTWNRGVEEGIIKLMEKERLSKPLIIGHFVQGVQLAVRLAVDYPDKVGGIILLGGPAKFIGIMNGKIMDNPLEKMIAVTDRYTAPVWFRAMKKDFFDANNFGPDIYSRDSALGTALWEQAATVPLPVAIRYACEYFAADVRAEMEKISCPVLVIRPRFPEEVLRKPVNSFLQPQFIDSWNGVKTGNGLVKIVDIPNTAAFVWKDNPGEVYKVIREFIAELK